MIKISYSICQFCLIILIAADNKFYNLPVRAASDTCFFFFAKEEKTPENYFVRFYAHVLQF